VINSESDIKTTLSRLSMEYSDGLRAETRRRIVTAASASASSRSVGRSISFWLAPATPFASLVAASALLLILALPALYLGRGGDAAGPRPVSDLEVSTVNGQVVLTWSDGDAPHRVVRATSREEMAQAVSSTGDRTRGELVRGERWVDRSSDKADIVYYLVE
jgi:hypothetical protein